MKYTHQNLDPHTGLTSDLYREAFGPGYQVSGVAIKALEGNTFLWTNRTDT